MAITSGSTALASDFVSTSAGGGDSGKVPKLNSSGVLDRSFMPMAVEVGTGSGNPTTYSLTTVAGQRVIVWAKGYADGAASGATISLKYNSVTKDSVGVDTSGASEKDAFSLMYSEVPGAATHDIEVSTSSGSIGNIVILVLKI